MDRYIKAPLDREEVKTLKAGDYVYITGTIYTCLLYTSPSPRDTR